MRRARRGDAEQPAVPAAAGASVAAADQALAAEAQIADALRERSGSAASEHAVID